MRCLGWHRRHGDRMNTLAITEPRPDRRTVVAGKVKTACNLMVWGTEDGAPLSWDDAARTVQISARSMRRALERPTVRRYLAEQRQVLRASIAAPALWRLSELSKQNQNANAAVNATKAILEMDEGDPLIRPGMPSAPGLVIIINNGRPSGNAPPVAIDVTPRRPGRQAETPSADER